MEWQQIKIAIDVNDIETVMGSLVMAGITGLEIEDPREFDEFLQNSCYYNYIEDDVMKMKDAPAAIKIYLPKNAQGQEMLSAVKTELARLFKDYSIKSDLSFVGMKEEDWANNWKKYFKPIRIGNKLIIKPSWEELNETEDRIVLEIDPSSSFGTGTHATTQLCLEALEDAIKPGCDVLDMGCGSGILSVGAMLLGAKSVTGVDIEEASIEVSMENAKRNRIDEGNFHLHCGNVLSDEKLADEIAKKQYDVVVANIVADVVIAMSSLFKRYLKQDGTLITSGIIMERIDDVVLALLKAGFIIKEIRPKDDWAAVVAVHR